VWNTATDRVVCIDPFGPNSIESPAWADRCLAVFADMAKYVSINPRAPPSYGEEISVTLPKQEDACSCGVYVLMYVLIIGHGYKSLKFDPTMVRYMRLALAHMLFKKKAATDILKQLLTVDS